MSTKSRPAEERQRRLQAALSATQTQQMELQAQLGDLQRLKREHGSAENFALQLTAQVDDLRSQLDTIHSKSHKALAERDQDSRDGLERLQRYLTWLREVQDLSQKIAAASQAPTTDERNASQTALAALAELTAIRERLEPTAFRQLKETVDTVVKYWQQQLAAQRARRLQDLIDRCGWPAENQRLPQNFAKQVELATSGLPEDQGLAAVWQCLSRVILSHMAYLFKDVEGIEYPLEYLRELLLRESPQLAQTLRLSEEEGAEIVGRGLLTAVMPGLRAHFGSALMKKQHSGRRELLSNMRELLDFDSWARSTFGLSQSGFALLLEDDQLRGHWTEAMFTSLGKIIDQVLTKPGLWRRAYPEALTDDEVIWPPAATELALSTFAEITQVLQALPDGADKEELCDTLLATPSRHLLTAMQEVAQTELWNLKNSTQLERQALLADGAISLVEGIGNLHETCSDPMLASVLLDLAVEARALAKACLERAADFVCQPALRALADYPLFLSSDWEADASTSSQQKEALVLKACRLLTSRSQQLAAPTFSRGSRSVALLLSGQKLVTFYTDQVLSAVDMDTVSAQAALQDLHAMFLALAPDYQTLRNEFSWMRLVDSLDADVETALTKFLALSAENALKLRTLLGEPALRQDAQSAIVDFGLEALPEDLLTLVFKELGLRPTESSNS